MKLLRNLPIAFAALAIAITPALSQEMMELPDLSQIGPPMDVVDPGDFTPDVIAFGPGGMAPPIPFAMPIGPEGPPELFFAAVGRGPGCGFGGGMNLTDDQLEKLSALKNSFLDKAGPKMFELSTAKRHLRNTMTAQTVDAKAAKALQEKINTLTGDIANMKLENRLAALDIFTPEQRKQMRECQLKASCCPVGGMEKGRMMMRHMMRMHHRGPGPGGPGGGPGGPGGPGGGPGGPGGPHD